MTTTEEEKDLGTNIDGSASSPTADSDTPASSATIIPKGRAALLAIFKEKNADIEEEPDDESLFDWAHKGIGERDEYEGKYNELNGSNEKLASVIAEDPRFMQFIAMVAGGENLMYSLGKCFGNMLDNLDEESLVKLKEGQAEYTKSYQTVKDNFSKYEATLKAYAEENGLDEDMAARINDAILDLAEAFNNRDIPREVIEIVHKGLDYDEDKTAKLEAARLDGKNEAIDEMKGSKAGKNLLPDPNGSSTNKVIQKKPKVMERKIIPLNEAIKEKE